MSRKPDSKGPSFMGWRGLPQRRPRRRSEADIRRMAQLAQRRMTRTGVILALITALTVVQGYRLFYWQVLQRDELLALANKPEFDPAAATPRGTIRDRNGYILATDAVTYKFGLSPNIVSYPRQTAARVATITGMDEGQLLDIMQTDNPYYVVAESVPYTVGQSLALLEERSFRLEPILTRSYPGEALGAHLLGFVNADRHGMAGIELYYDGLLTGSDPQPVPEGPAAEEIELGDRPFRPTEEGVDLILTLDRAVQVMAEQELAAAIQETGATRGTIIVMEPHTGDILAMANQPTYDPNRFTDYLDDPSIFLNPAISEIYEPGSVFKIITVATALDLGLVTPDTVWNDPGVFEAGGRLITNWDHRAYGPRTVTEILGYSLNTGTAWLNTLVGAEQFYQYVDAFGFGQLSGVDAGSEVAGQVKHPGDGLWHPSDMGTNAFGQGIAVTPLQMINSVASLLNDGKLMQPRFVRAMVNHGHLQEIPPVVRGQSVSPATANTMRELMANAVAIETESALPSGWRIGGKTGTSQIPIPGGYHPTDTIASFIGYAPADAPQFIILVRLDRPQGAFEWGSTSAAPTFKRLTTRLLEYYHIPPDEIRLAHTAP